MSKTGQLLCSLDLDRALLSHQDYHWPAVCLITVDTPLYMISFIFETLDVLMCGRIYFEFQRFNSLIKDMSVIRVKAPTIIFQKVQSKCWVGIYSDVTTRAQELFKLKLVTFLNTTY